MSLWASLRGMWISFRSRRILSRFYFIVSSFFMIIMIPKNFMILFDKLILSHDRVDVFRDFLDMSLFVLSGGAYRDDYERINKSYDVQEKDFFIQMLQIVANHSECFYDLLGDIFMDCISRGHNGQFFTPIHVADFMAEMICGTKIRPGQSVYDPTCGSGRLLLSAVKCCTKDRPNERIFCYGSDIDLTCVKMTAVNMLMNSIPGEIAWMNPLTMEHWRSYKIRLQRVFGIWIPSFKVCGSGETNLLVRAKEVIKQQNVYPDVQQQLLLDFGI